MLYDNSDQGFEKQLMVLFALFQSVLSMSLHICHSERLRRIPLLRETEEESKNPDNLSSATPT